MSATQAPTSLQSRITELLHDADAVVREEKSRTESEMGDVVQQMDQFQAQAPSWLDEIVVPRLRTLALAFHNSTGPQRSPSTCHASVCFERTDEFPVDARLDVSIAHDARRSCAVVTASPSIIPILMDLERECSQDVSLQTPDTRALEAFIDDRIVRFVADYLRVRDPESPYQRNLTVTDPVCGMLIRRAAAAASLEWEGRRYYFCIDHCRERFESNPARYTTTSHLAARGGPA